MKHLGIITPLVPEAKCFTAKPVYDRPVQLSDCVTLVVSGEGQARAESAARLLLDMQVDGILITGMAGAMVPELAPGDIVLPEKIHTNSNQTYRISKVWINKTIEYLEQFNIPVNTGPLFSTDGIVNGAVDKARFHRQYQGVAVDMESTGVLALAQHHDVPCLAIRSIIDPVDFSFPEFILRKSSEYGELPVSGLIVSMLGNPHKLPSLFRLIRYYRQAIHSLRKVASHPERLLLTGQ